MIRVYLMRHAKTEGAAALNGRTDVIVAPERQRQLAEQLRGYNFQRVITSPLRRCADVARLLQQADPALTVNVEADFRELDFGLFDGCSFDELAPHWSTLEAFWQSPAVNPLPQAEPLEECYQRVCAGWQRWFPVLPDNSLIIAHGGTIRLLLAHILKVDWRNPAWYASLSIGNQTLTRLDIFPAEPPVVAVKSISSEIKGNVLN